MELSIKEQLMADMKTAMKAKEEGRLALGVIRMARAHICLLYTSDAADE